MPRAARICNKQGCVDITTNKGGYCDTHQLPAWQNTKPRTIPGWQRIRLHILHRDNYTCQYCGAQATEVDHVIPLSRGGNSKPSNLLASCTPCNAKKNIQQRRQPPPNHHPNKP